MSSSSDILIDIILVSVFCVIFIFAIEAIIEYPERVEEMKEVCLENKPYNMLFTGNMTGSLNLLSCSYETITNLPYRKCTIIFEESKYHGMQEVERDCTG